MHSSGQGYSHKLQYMHSDISIENRDTNIFLAVSLDVIPKSKSNSDFLGFLTVSIFIQSTGHALSHCRQPMQSSISTCNLERIRLYSSFLKPIFLSGIGHFSCGYCNVATNSSLFFKCLKVNFIPSNIVLTLL